MDLDSQVNLPCNIHASAMQRVSTWQPCLLNADAMTPSLPRSISDMDGTERDRNWGVQSEWTHGS